MSEGDDQFASPKQFVVGGNESLSGILRTKGTGQPSGLNRGRMNK